MYANVDLTTARRIAAADSGRYTGSAREGTQAAVVGSDRLVHFQRLQLGRDFGIRLKLPPDYKPAAGVVNPATRYRKAQSKPVLLRRKSARPEDRCINRC